jgi:hypothetical protein
MSVEQQIIDYLDVPREEEGRVEQMRDGNEEIRQRLEDGRPNRTRMSTHTRCRW